MHLRIRDDEGNAPRTGLSAHRKALRVAAIAAVPLTTAVLWGCSSPDAPADQGLAAVTLDSAGQDQSIELGSGARNGTGSAAGDEGAAGADDASAAGTNAGGTAAEQQAQRRRAAARIAATRERQAAARARRAAVARAAATAARKARAEKARRAAATRRPAPAPAAKPVRKPAPRPAAAPTGTSGWSSAEREVLRLVNQQRRSAGCGALAGNGTLHTVAAAHSRDMAAKGYFDHADRQGRSPFDRMRQAGYQGRRMAENIAAGQTSPAAVMDAWMKSPGHRANILDCALREIGVGLHKGGSMRFYWTQDFGTR